MVLTFLGVPRAQKSPLHFTRPRSTEARRERHRRRPAMKPDGVVIRRPDEVGTKWLIPRKPGSGRERLILLRDRHKRG